MLALLAMWCLHTGICIVTSNRQFHPVLVYPSSRVNGGEFVRTTMWLKEVNSVKKRMFPGEITQL